MNQLVQLEFFKVLLEENLLLVPQKSFKYLNIGSFEYARIPSFMKKVYSKCFIFENLFYVAEGNRNNDIGIKNIQNLILHQIYWELTH